MAKIRPKNNDDYPVEIAYLREFKGEVIDVNNEIEWLQYSLSDMIDYRIKNDLKGDVRFRIELKLENKTYNGKKYVKM